MIWIHSNTENTEYALLWAKDLIGQNVASTTVYLFGERANSETSKGNSFNGAEAEIVYYKVEEDSNFIQNCSRARRLLILMTDEESSKSILELLHKAASSETPKLHQIEIQGNKNYVCSRMQVYICIMYMSLGSLSS